MKCEFPTLLLILFIALKVCGVINWSWLWVLSPLWISFFAIVVLEALIGVIDKKRGKRKDSK
jgi:hypothetical protein